MVTRLGLPDADVGVATSEGELAEPDEDEVTEPERALREVAIGMGAECWKDSTGDF